MPHFKLINIPWKSLCDQTHAGMDEVPDARRGNYRSGSIISGQHQALLQPLFLVLPKDLCQL
jgi:hypothetical protein